MKEIDKKSKNLIDKAIISAFDNCDWSLVKIMEPGESAAVFCIEHEGRKLIARISDPTRPQSNIPFEYICMQQASDYYVAPYTYYCNAEENICIMDYIETRPLPFFSIYTNKDISSLGDIISTLHSGQAFPISSSIFDMLNMIGSGMKQAFVGDSYVEDSLKIVDRYKPILNNTQDMRPSHRDLHGFNLLFNGENLYLIDWEAAGNESMYYDLAVAFNTILFENENNAKILLKAYFKQQPTDVQVAKFNLMRVVAYINYGLILMYLSTSIQESRLSVDEIEYLPEYGKYIREQIDNGSPKINSYLEFAYAMLKKAIKFNGSKIVLDAYTLLQTA